MKPAPEDPITRCIRAWLRRGEIGRPCRAWCEITLEPTGLGELVSFIYLRDDELSLLAIYTLRAGRIFFEGSRTEVFGKWGWTLCRPSEEEEC